MNSSVLKYAIEIRATGMGRFGQSLRWDGRAAKHWICDCGVLSVAAQKPHASCKDNQVVFSDGGHVQPGTKCDVLVTRRVFEQKSSVMYRLQEGCSRRNQA
jgi:hypothetical protein